MAQIGTCDYCGIVTFVEINGYGLPNCRDCGLTRYGQAKYTTPTAEEPKESAYRAIYPSEVATNLWAPRMFGSQEMNEEYHNEIVARFKGLEL